MLKSVIFFGGFFVVTMALENCSQSTSFAYKVKITVPGNFYDKPCTTKCVLGRFDQEPSTPYQFGVEYQCADDKYLELCADGFAGKAIPYRSDGKKFLDGICCNFDFCTKYVEFDTEGKFRLNAEGVAKAEAKKKADEDKKKADEAAKEAKKKVDEDKKKADEAAEEAKRKSEEAAKKIEEGANEAGEKAKEAGKEIEKVFGGKCTVVNVLMPILCVVFFCFQ